ncbi:MAG: hypothetical protein ACODAF_05520 [Actinomycetota bacterium]
MSRYDADLERLAIQLARMAADPAGVAAVTDTATVNRARLAVRRWCRTVLDDVVPAQQADVAKQPGLADLGRHPVGVLQVLLGNDPQPLEHQEPPSPQVGEAADEQWRRLAHAVEVVAHEWSNADPASRPTGERAWATVADVAAVAEAAALLDRDLAARNQPARRPNTRDCWEIAVAAEQVRQLAVTGPLLSAPPLRPASRRLKPVRARSIDTLPPALANLAALVAGARSLGPGTVGALAATHARTVHTLAGALAATGLPSQRAVRKQLATALHKHADMLVNVQAAGRRLQSLDADDPRPALQMQEIRTGLRQLGASSTARAAFRNDQPSLLAALAAGLELAPAVAACVYAHIQSGRWLQPRASAKLGWEQVAPDAPIAEAAMLVQGQAHTLARQVPRPSPSRSPHRSPHELLTPRLLRPDRQRGPGSTAAHTPTLGDAAGGP